MAVPPMGFISLMKSIAILRFLLLAFFMPSKSASVSVENRMTSKRSPSFKFATQNWNAFFACSSLLPAIEPEVSRTNATSFSTILPASTSMPGEASNRK